MKRILISLFAATTLGFSAVSHAGKVSPEKVDGATTVNAAEAKALFDKGVIFVDTRKDKDWAAGRIPDAVHIELKNKFNEASLSDVVKKDQDVVFYCNGHSCMRSSEASAQAVGWGFSKVHYFRDGFPAWKDAGYPVE